ncbi:histidine kinase [Rhodanobacter sp. MP1X3]|uniref:sensor histidine kinase n=1 Tax=Rhodanobacter sp. MP1X3 TaxID=2723086 RepID=UPI00182AAE52|nr:histidine kinase [Rhodanobacter sp. MP1X3]MBB6241680.1 two-component system sensor histidine kinase AlgZ [Rhodanobacter sp. MP1X3]
MAEYVVSGSPHLIEAVMGNTNFIKSSNVLGMASRHKVPFLLPVLAGMPIILCMGIMGLPELAFAHAAGYRVFFAAAYVAWSFPLTAFQRALWRRISPLAMTLVLLLTTYLFSVINNVGAQALALHWGQSQLFSWSRNLRGLDGCWLAMIAFCAIHAVVAYYFELQTAQDRLRDAEGLARDAELRALRYQLHPHFLYNTLNAISSLVLERRSDEAVRMIASLGELLRATLDSSNTHEVTLAEELATTELYLEIEKVRFGKRLLVDVRVGPDALGALVPSLLLQPLVENAIRHGIALRRVPGRLDLHITRDGDRLRLTLYNDGNPPENIIESRTSGVGLRNTRERLKKLYPEGHSIDLRLNEAGGCTIEMILPFRHMEPARIAA